MRMLYIHTKNIEQQSRKKENHERGILFQELKRKAKNKLMESRNFPRV